MARGGRRLRGGLGWLPALVLVGAGMGVAAVVAVPHDQESATRKVYPLDSGTTWIYAVTDHDEPSGTHTRQVVERGQLLLPDGTLVTNAARVQDSYTDYPGTGPRTSGLYLASRGDHVDQYAVLSATHDLEQLDPPAEVYADATTVGDGFSYDGKFNFQDFGFRTELAERGPVTVSGHTFEGCSRWVTTVPIVRDGQPTTQDTIDEWTCPGYGPVRSTDRYDANDVLVSEELVAFHGPDRSWSSGDEPPLPPGGDDVATAQGFDQARTNAVPDGVLGSDLAWSTEREATSDVPPVGYGHLMISGDQQGWVTATDVRTGELRWQVRLTPPVLVTPAVSGDGVVVADGAKRLWSLAVADGHTQWAHTFDDVVTQTPALTSDAVVVGTDDGKVTALDPSDGAVAWTASLGGRLTGPPAVDDDHVYVADTGGSLTAFELTDGDEAWSQTVVESSLGGPAVADGTVVAQDDDGVVFAFDSADGSLAWQSHAHGNTSPSLAVSDGTVVAMLDTRDVYALDLDDGHERWRTRVDVALTSPVVVGDTVVSVSTKGQLTTLDLDNGHRSGGWALPRPTHGQQPSVVLAPTLVDDALVVSSTPTSGPTDLVSYAYPVRAGAGTGTLLDLTEVPLPSPPTEPLQLLDDGSFLLAGFDRTLSRVEPGGTVRTLVTSQDRIATTGVLAGELLVTRRDDQLLALPADGGEPRWSIPAGDAYTGSTPAVDHGTVYAGTSDGRLLAVGLEDGKTLWTAPVSTSSLPKPPLVLPSGDVVYGVGLTRYDGRTGAAVWSEPGTNVYGAPVAAGGLVIGAAFLSDGSAGLAAWDAATGRRQWLLPGTVGGYVGPTVSDGKVVWGDGGGVLHVVDAVTGTESWRLDLHRQLGGIPVVRDGRVYVFAHGRPEDLDERDNRVVVLDLATGRFLASYEPPGALNEIVPASGPGDAAVPLLVPGSRGSTQVIEVRPHG